MTSRETILILMHNPATQFIDIANQYVKLFEVEKYQVTVAYLSGTLDEQAKAKTLSEEVLFLECNKREIRGLKINALKKLIALCRSKKFSIVIAHRYKPIYLMLWVAQFCKISKLFFVMHAMKTLNFLSRRLFIAALARKNMYFAGVSNAVRDDLRKHIWRVPNERIVTLYNCIDMQIAEKNLLSRTEARAALKLSMDSFILGTVGRLAPEKDQQNMIVAFAKIKSQLPNAKLLLIGSGPLENDLRTLTKKLQLEQDVIFAGFLPDAQRYLHVFDVFMLVSTKEAFGRVLLEAMIARVPVIGSKTNGIPEVVGNAGKLVTAGNADQLANEMMAFVEMGTDERMAWGEKGYQRVRENFSIEVFAEDFWSYSSHSPCSFPPLKKGE